MNTPIRRQWIGAVEDEWSMYSDKSEDYRLGSPIGFGASSMVYEAQYIPLGGSAKPIACALKVLDLDALPQDSLQFLYREAQLMSISKHPNVIRVRGTWMEGTKLYIAMRLMDKGSAADVMRYGWPGGMEEEVVRCTLKQALEGINYLHVNGLIHRDIKAANLLISDDGTVLIGDLGVAAPLVNTDAEHRTSTTRTIASAVDSATPARKIGKRKSFVGTPCWMAPELIQGKQYDASADIWSFGITALELAQGRPPLSRESAKKVLVKIVTNAPPQLDRSGGDHQYSRAFEEVVEACLNKDPTKRPTAQELLQKPFFKNAKRPSYLVNAILQSLPPLTQRQERRRAPSLIPQSTIASWDFQLTGPRNTLLGRTSSSNTRRSKRPSDITTSLSSSSDGPPSPGTASSLSHELFDLDIAEEPGSDRPAAPHRTTDETIQILDESPGLETVPLALVPSIGSSASETDVPVTPPASVEGAVDITQISSKKKKKGSRPSTPSSPSAAGIFSRSLLSSKQTWKNLMGA